MILNFIYQKNVYVNKKLNQIEKNQLCYEVDLLFKSLLNSC